LLKETIVSTRGYGFFNPFSIVVFFVFIFDFVVVINIVVLVVDTAAAAWYY